MAKVFLGMSGGVDSSVSAVLLKAQGHTVTGVYMKNWSKDLPGMKCPWAEDLADAKRVAVQLDLDFEVWDFEAEYKQRVVDYMLTEFQKGRTPNPDVMCNEQIKFKLFYERAMERGADYIATGHYARLSADNAQLLRARDENKDQTYFLYRMGLEATSRARFPVGDMLKPEVKALAAKHGLDVAHKKESMGVCFVGEVGMKDFLSEYLHPTPGEIREAETNKVLGYHDGAIFYTIGQRHGLYLGGGLPYYVVKKDLNTNTVYVSRNLNHSALWTDCLQLEQVILRTAIKNPNLMVRLRHRAPLIPARLEFETTTNSENTASSNHCNPGNHGDDDVNKSDASFESSSNLHAKLIFPSSVKRPAAGQSAVFYQGEVCLGGGIIASDYDV